MRNGLLLARVSISLFSLSTDSFEFRIHLAGRVRVPMIQNSRLNLNNSSHNRETPLPCEMNCQISRIKNGTLLENRCVSFLDRAAYLRGRSGLFSWEAGCDVALVNLLSLVSYWWSLGHWYTIRSFLV